MRIDVVVNTTAHVHRARPLLLPRLRQIAGGAASVHATSSLGDLARTAHALADRGSDLVVLSGGDGSFMAGVTALARAFGEERLPMIALLPGGTVATVARNWGMRGDPAELFERLMARRGELSAMLRPTLRVTGKTRSGRQERVGFMFGTGLVAKFFDVYYREGAGGHAGAARIVARVFAESFWNGAYARSVLDPLPCSIEVGARALAPPAWSLVCCSVVRDLGLHMLVNYRAGEDLQRPHLVASALSSRDLGPRAPLVLAGRRIGGSDHFDDLVDEFTVRFSTDDDAGGPYVLDGDMLRAHEVRVAAGPVIRVITLE